MEQNDILLVTPPFTQPNTPYPATMQLMGFLRSNGIKAVQFDLAIEVYNQIFSKETFESLFETIETDGRKLSRDSKKIIANKEYYLTYIGNVITFLQSKDNTLAFGLSTQLKSILSESISGDELDMLFGSAGVHDWAKYNCTKFIEELGTFIQKEFDEYFSFTKYAEYLSLVAIEFEPLLKALNHKTFISEIIEDEIINQIKLTNPKIVGFTIPFPGNLYGALVAAKSIKKLFPEIKIVMGGGFINTELRWLTEKRIFNFTDYLCIDDGELPLFQLINHINDKNLEASLVRTFYLKNGEIKYSNSRSKVDPSHDEICTPNYENIDFTKYISFLSTTNPMQRLWSDGKWNKMALAHGCYWAKCSFCDTTLDYIKRFSKPNIEVLLDRVESVKRLTKCSGFHFVDEAAPPALIRDLCNQLIERRTAITWWVNIRFEKSFTKELIELMAKAGCIAVSGGLEVASDRLLKLMNKGVTIEQVASVTHHFSQSNIMVHAYLMYGFPTETEQETIDSLEVVRQLFDNNLIQSAYWHRFALTEHSDVGQNPAKYAITKIDNDLNQFTRNDVSFVDPIGCEHEKYSEGLRISLYNYMQGVGLDMKINEWFRFKTVKTNHKENFIANIIEKIGDSKKK